MAHAAFEGEQGSGAAFEGRYFTARRLLNSPQSLSRPRPPILIGGGGELKTLGLVARYADACNVFGGPENLLHKYEVLQAHCERVGRDYDLIEKTNLSSIAITEDGARGSLTPAALVDRLGAWSDAGSMHAIFSVRDVWDLSKLEIIGRDVLPQVRDIGDPSPID
jgi:alkanesulfonate monooxygenase SsuD/methylene tetrahydromethanopterin reductase-like flavin-dependent oxidoreductase (luciferase family)